MVKKGKDIILFIVVVGLLTYFFVSSSLASTRFSETVTNTPALAHQAIQSDKTEETFEESTNTNSDENSEEISETSSENDIIEESEEISEASSENNIIEESEEVPETSSEDSITKESTEVTFEDSEEYESYDGSIPYTAQDLFILEATMYCECGAQGTSYQVQVANAWIARNKIEQEMANGSSNPFRTALNHNHYQGVYDDEFGWRVISQQEGVISQELIDTNPAIHEICIGVLDGEIPSPIYDWDCCICCKTYEFSEVVEIAESLGLVNFFVIENGIFFPSSEWTEECTQYLLNW